MFRRFVLRRIRPLYRWMTLGLLAAASFAGAGPDSEHQIKAAYLVNFMKYVEWPVTTRTTTTICLFGRDTLGTSLAGYEGRSVGGKELLIRRAHSPDDIANCQLVFVPDVEEARISAVLRWVEGLPVLVVSDAEGFARMGGGMELVQGGNRVQFIVNNNALARAGLKPGSQMLRLALRVIGGEH